MVTIEQKLTLFSKLLNQELKEDVDKKAKELEKEYEAKITESKYRVDREAADIIDDARRRGEEKKIELISKGKMSSKKQAMLIKEEVVVRFIEALVERTRNFTAQPNYKVYLENTMKQLDELRNYENPLIVYMTEKDISLYMNLVKNGLVDIGIKAEQIQFEEATSDILGGLIIADPILNMKIDMSMRSIIEESKERIVELITIALGEAGECGE